MRCLILAAGLLVAEACLAGGGPAPILDEKPPHWETLEYLQRAFWLQAESRIRLAPCEGPGQAHWCLEAENLVADNREVLRMEAAADGALSERVRESIGREERRIKQWQYRDSKIARVRMEPSGKGATTDFEVTSKRVLSVPREAERVTDALLLLALATPDAGGSPTTSAATVHTDLNFYTVVLSAAGATTLEVDFELDGERVSGTRNVYLVNLSVRPLAPLSDKPDFSLLGLSEPITIAYDSATGIPLQVRGRAPRLGETEINLRAAHTRQSVP